jgi:hypothetical protein
MVMIVGMISVVMPVMITAVVMPVIVTVVMMVVPELLRRYGARGRRRLGALIEL